MKLMLTAAALLIALAGNAWAADQNLPINKAPAGYPYNSSGWYVGLGALAEVARANIDSIDTGPTSLYSAGAALTGTVGWQGRLGSSGNWWAAENIVSWTNIGGTVTCTAGVPCSVNSTFGVEQRVMFGFPVTQILSFLPNWGSVFPALPPLPNGVVTTSSHPYLMASVHEDDVSGSFGLMTGRAWQIRPGIGMGMINQWTNGFVVDVWAEYLFRNSAFTLGPTAGIAQANEGSKALTGVSFKY